MADLSPAAQAVFWEFNRAASGKPDDWHYLPAIAAVLRAAASQMVVPLPQTPSEYDVAQYDGREEVIANLLNIAAELEAQ